MLSDRLKNMDHPSFSFYSFITSLFRIKKKENDTVVDIVESNPIRAFEESPIQLDNTNINIEKEEKKINIYLDKIKINGSEDVKLFIYETENRTSETFFYLNALSMKYKDQVYEVVEKLGAHRYMAGHTHRDFPLANNKNKYIKTSKETLYIRKRALPSHSKKEGVFLMVYTIMFFIVGFIILCIIL